MYPNERFQCLDMPVRRHELIPNLAASKYDAVRELFRNLLDSSVISEYEFGLLNSKNPGREIERRRLLNTLIRMDKLVPGPYTLL